MIVVTDISDVESGATVTSEATGYELENAIDYDSPWLKWRSEDLNTQTISLPFSGSINSVTLLGANFVNVTISFDSVYSEAEALGYLRALGQYRGLFENTDQSGVVEIEIPNQACDDTYFTLSGIVLGNTNSLTHGANGDIDKRLMQPVNEIKLGSEVPKKGALGDSYHVIKVTRRGNTISDLDEFRDIKRVVGKINSFVFFEDLGKTEDVFLVKRIEPFTYSKAGYLDYHDSMTMEEIAG